MNIKKQFEQNFLDGDELPARATTFSASGGLDIAEYFYNLGREETIREVESETSKIPKIEMTLSDITDILNCLSKRIEEIKILNKLKK